MTGDDQIERAITAAVERMTSALVADLKSVVADLSREATVERDLAVAAAREESGATVAAALAKATAEHDGRLAEAVESARSNERAALEAAIDQARREAQAEATRLVEAVRGEAGEALAAARAEAAVALDTARAEAAGEREDALAAERAEAARTQAAADAEVARLSQALADSIAAAPAGLAASDSAAREAVRAEERHADLACTERLLDAARTVDRARSLGDVLAALLEYARGEAGRAALFLVHDDAFRVWQAEGFDEASPVDAGFTLPRHTGGPLAEAVRTGAPTPTPAGGADPLVGGLAPGRVGLAVPLAIGGQPVAVLYADEGSSDTPCHPSGWPELVEIATRHAGRTLELLTLGRLAAQRQAAASISPSAATLSPPDLAPAEPDASAARRHARLVIAEIRLYNEQAVTEGKRAGNLRSRLATEISRARRLYEARIPPTVPDRDGVFEEELVRTLADGDPGVMGQAE